MLLRIYMLLYFFFLLAPIVVIVLFSFHALPSLSFPLQGFSFRWYAEVWKNELLLQGIWNSVIVAAATALATGLIGSLAALSFPRLPRRLRSALGVLVFAPIALPGLVLGISLLVLFAMVNVQLSLTTVVIAHVLATLPFFVIAARSRIEMFDMSLEEAARDLGATPIQAFRLVTLPIILPTLIGAAIMSFALSFDEFIVTSFVIGTDSTLPMVLWSMMRRTVTPLINAVSTIALAISLVGVLAAAALFEVQQRRSKAMRRFADAEDQ